MPDGVARTGIAEQTLLEFQVGPDGEITDIAFVQSSGNAALDTAAIRCLGNWHAAPSEAGRRGALYAHIYWNSPAPACLGACPVGTFTIGRPQTCDGFYPPDKAKAKIGGTTLLRILVTAKGTVVNAEVVRSSGDADLDQAARSCVEYWHYEPATQNGVPVDFVKEVAIGWSPH